MVGISKLIIYDPREIIKEKLGMFWKLGSASAAVDLRSMDLLIQAEVWFTTAPEVVFETSIFS